MDLNVEWLGRMRYREAWNVQRARQPRDSRLQLGDADVKGCVGLIEAGSGRDLWERATEPAH